LACRQAGAVQLQRHSSSRILRQLRTEVRQTTVHTTKGIRPTNQMPARHSGLWWRGRPKTTLEPDTTAYMKGTQSATKHTQQTSKHLAVANQVPELQFLPCLLLCSRTAGAATSSLCERQATDCTPEAWCATVAAKQCTAGSTPQQQPSSRLRGCHKSLTSRSTGMDRRPDCARQLVAYPCQQMEQTSTVWTSLGTGPVACATKRRVKKSHGDH
jgi:hypothetical protein